MTKTTFTLFCREAIFSCEFTHFFGIPLTGLKNVFLFYFDLTGVPHVNAITMLGMPQVIQGIPVDIH